MEIGDSLTDVALEGPRDMGVACDSFSNLELNWYLRAADVVDVYMVDDTADKQDNVEDLDEGLAG
ncbi:uncharacterized protein DSM5745_00050 [Aspergillus mulundensis]|uniref:Uncharacterized protein n=1 Tax=Aspergillus mulundensis TaxID=1810919 RepID=A0A3D8T405_9EURO|nr:hypothetical protein DSM5745_00050 [Aspergillus mulundensis]RDW92728.1 hypothetical protein DSM5745_00050 [Aspergillus mulundensis]